MPGSTERSYIPKNKHKAIIMHMHVIKYLIIMHDLLVDTKH